MNSSHSFLQGRSFGQEVTLKWTLKCFEEVADPEGADETDSDDEDESGETIGLILSPVNPSKSKSDDKWLQIFFRASAKIILGDEVLFEGDTGNYHLSLYVLFAYQSNLTIN